MDVLSLWAGVLSYGSKQYPEVHLHVITQILLLLNRFMKKVRLQTNTLTLLGTFSINLKILCIIVNKCMLCKLPFLRRGVFPTEGA